MSHLRAPRCRAVSWWSLIAIREVERATEKSILAIAKLSRGFTALTKGNLLVHKRHDLFAMSDLPAPWQIAAQSWLDGARPIKRGTREFSICAHTIFLRAQHSKRNRLQTKSDPRLSVRNRFTPRCHAVARSSSLAVLVLGRTNKCAVVAEECCGLTVFVEAHDGFVVGCDREAALEESSPREAAHR